MVARNKLYELFASELYEPYKLFASATRESTNLDDPDNLRGGGMLRETMQFCDEYLLFVK